MRFRASTGSATPSGAAQAGVPVPAASDHRTGGD